MIIPSHHLSERTPQHEASVYQQLVEQSVVPLWLVDLSDAYTLCESGLTDDKQPFENALSSDALARAAHILTANQPALDLLGAPSLAALNSALVEASYAWLVQQMARMLTAIVNGEKRLTMAVSGADLAAQQASMWFSFSLPSSDAARKIVSACALEAASLQATQAEFATRKASDISDVDARLRMAAKVFENNADGIYIVDSHGAIVQLNSALCRICVFEEQHLLGRKPAGLLIPTGDGDALHQQNVQHALQNGYWQGEQLALRSSGEMFHVFATTTVVRASNDDILATICTLRDITESKSREQRIRHLAFYDALTELPNRTLFQDRLKHELQRCERGNQTAALLFLDLDHFKAINDSLGHAAGDQLLREVAGRFGEHVRGDDTIARMGGDEFTIILSGQRSREHVLAAAANVARKIAAQLTEPFFIEGHEVFASASIGIALYPDDGKDSSTLLRNGDTAMYFAKQAGKKNYQFYSSNMSAHSVEQLAFQNSLHRAAVEQEFELHYQPQFSYRSHKVVGVECLLRWSRADGVLLLPGEFVQVAEQSGVIVRIGEWTIRRACTQMVEWLSAGLALDHISINVSARQFMDENLLSCLAAALHDSGLPARCVELELTESVLMANIELTLQTLAKLKQLGVRIAIDNFGTGYSSLNYLKELPVDTLKIDRRFVHNLPGSNEDQQIINVIFALARGFDLTIVAEGVETAAQSDYLVNLGCEVAQGYYFARPQQAYDLGQLLRNNSKTVDADS